MLGVLLYLAFIYLGCERHDLYYPSVIKLTLAQSLIHLPLSTVDSVIQQLDEAGKTSSGPDFSWTEVMKLLVIKSPLEVVRLTSLAGCQFTRSATDV